VKKKLFYKKIEFFNNYIYNILMTSFTNNKLHIIIMRILSLKVMRLFELLKIYLILIELLLFLVEIDDFLQLYILLIIKGIKHRNCPIYVRVENNNLLVLILSV